MPIELLVKHTYSGEPPIDRDYRLDGFRAIACLMVYWHHTGTAIFFPPIVVFGSTGVYLFFALSGYLLFRPTVSAVNSGRLSASVLQFYKRRAVRIGPPYLVALVIYTVARVTIGEDVPSAGELLLRVFLVSNYFPSINFYGVCAVFWTLAIEAQYYLLLPPLTRGVLTLAGGRPVAVATAFVLLGLSGRGLETGLSQWLYGDNSQVVYRSVFSYLDLFGYGMGVAVLERTGRLRYLPWWAWLSMSTALFLIANNWLALAGDWVASNDAIYANIFPPLIGMASALALVVTLIIPARWGGWLGARPLRFVGHTSYSLYLYHVGVQFALFHLIDLNPWINHFYLRGFVYGLIFLVPTLVVSTVMFALVERPCLRWAAAIRAAEKSNPTPDRL